VLLADPAAIRRFDEHEVVLPVVVISELEGKRHHPELGYFARSALRLLDELRVEHGRLDEPIPMGGQGGTLRVSSTTPTPRCCRLAFGWVTTTPASSPSPATSPPTDET
jgi:PhoH-like ATPase